MFVAGGCPAPRSCTCALIRTSEARPRPPPWRLSSPGSCSPGCSSTTGLLRPRRARDHARPAWPARSCFSPGRCYPPLWMRTDLFDFELPEDRIALHPASPRDAARLLVVPAGEAALADRAVRDLPELLRAGDALVFNDTRVIPAALEGVRLRGDARAQVSCQPASSASTRAAGAPWRARPSACRRATASASATTAASACSARSTPRWPRGRGRRGRARLRPARRPTSTQAIAAVGRHAAAALHRRASARAEDGDRSDYQTVYARNEGAVAAPTAGLHFTPELFAALEARGISAPLRDAACRRRHVPAGEGRGYRRPQHARRVGRGLGDDGGGAQRGARARRPHRRRRHHLAAPAGDARRATARSRPSPARPPSSSRRATASAPSTC